ncbi:MAG: radical SAM protein [Elusimicrobia bacterium]|nr:radical SAM protein [Elusimicrobiota bacterium]
MRRPLTDGKRPTVLEFFSTFVWDEYYFPMDASFQNYTYFPAASTARIRGCWTRTLELIRRGQAPPHLGLYIHWPYCPSQCTYCYCSMAVPKSRAELAGHLAMLKREMDSLKDLFRGVEFSSVWLGGGTPTFMEDAQLDDLLGHARASFVLGAHAQVYVESSPATLTASKLAILLKHGVNRLTLGIQTLDEGVLAHIDRAGQRARAAKALLRLLTDTPGLVTDVDLMVGLEGQTPVSFLRDLTQILKIGPAALHLFAFNERPQTLFSREGKTLDAAQRRRLATLMALADKIIAKHGYRSPVVDTESMQLDSAEEKQDGAVRKFGGSVLGLGYSAISHAFGSAWYYHPLAAAGGKALDDPPPYFALSSGLHEEMRGYALRHLSLYLRISRASFRTLFGKDPMAVRPLKSVFEEWVRSGVVAIDSATIRWVDSDPVRRRVLLKNLYSDKVVRLLLRAREEGFARFEDEKRRSPDAWRLAVQAKSEARSLFRVYQKPKAAVPPRLEIAA